MTIKSPNDVELFEGDDPELPWETRLRNYADHDHMPLHLARHLADIELGYKEVED